MSLQKSKEIPEIEIPGLFLLLNLYLNVIVVFFLVPVCCHCRVGGKKKFPSCVYIFYITITDAVIWLVPAITRIKKPIVADGMKLSSG